MALSFTYDNKLRTSKLPVEITITGATRALVGITIHKGNVNIGPFEYLHTSGSVTIDISKIITDEKFEHFTKTFTDDLILSQYIVDTYTITFYERAVDSATKYGEATSNSFPIIHADFDDYLNENYGSIQEYCEATGNFLLTHSNTIHTNDSIASRLYFFCPYDVDEAFLKVNGTNYSLADIAENTISEIVLPLYKLFGLHGNTLNIKVIMGGDYTESQTITIIKNAQQSPFERNWLFLNSLGVYEHIATTGKFSKTSKNKSTVKELNSTQKAEYNIKRTKIINKPTNDNSWAGNTGNMYRTDEKRIEEFINSTDVYLFNDQNYIPVNIVSATLENHTDDAFIVSAKIEIEPAFKSALLFELSENNGLEAESWAKEVLNDLRIKPNELSEAEFTSQFYYILPLLLDKEGDLYPTYGPYGTDYTTDSDFLGINPQWANTIIANYRTRNLHIPSTEWNTIVQPYLYAQFTAINNYYYATFKEKTVADFFFFFQVDGNITTRESYINSSNTTVRWDIDGSIYTGASLPSHTLGSGDGYIIMSHTGTAWQYDEFYLLNNPFINSLPNLSGLNISITLDIDGCQFSDTLPNIAFNTSECSIYAAGNNFTSCESYAGIGRCNYLLLTGSNMTTSAIDTLLHNIRLMMTYNANGFDQDVDYTINLSGTGMGIPTGGSNNADILWMALFYEGEDVYLGSMTIIINT